MFINLPEEVESALDILQNSGFDAYVVGGCVRDSIIGIEPKDWDITTSALPDEIIKCFKDYKIIETGIKHGTVTVLINKIPLEVTTYRIDGKYKDNRRPEAVEFTNDISLDLMRRDFTINALAYNSDGLVDIYGGVEDINLKQIKCVGDPDARFNEDGLRILRALRIASVLNFQIEKDTSAGIHKNKDLLNNISEERITCEFNKLVCGSNFFQIMADYKDVFEVFIHEIRNINYENWIKILKSMTYVSKDLILRLTLIFQNIEDREVILKNLKYDNYAITNVKILCGNLYEEIIPEPSHIKRFLNKIGYENFKKLLIVKKAIIKSSSVNLYEINRLSEIEEIGRKIVEENQCYRLKDLKINGQDLIEAGFKKGKLVGYVLNDMLHKVIEGELSNDRENLTDYIKKYKKLLDKDLF
jgi:tRNA nucleotidyltransferase (CCA-adding enzyme)